MLRKSLVLDKIASVKVIKTKLAYIVIAANLHLYIIISKKPFFSNLKHSDQRASKNQQTTIYLCFFSPSILACLVWGRVFVSHYPISIIDFAQACFSEYFFAQNTWQKAGAYRSSKYR